MVDAGADLFVGHGPHVLRGIEMYKGKPIMYSLGDFIFQNETLLRLPSENYEPYNLGPTAHVNDFNDARYDFDKSGFPSDPPIWWRCIPSRSAMEKRAACAAGRCSPRVRSARKYSVTWSGCQRRWEQR
jgi:hypothetical protein